MPRKTNKPEKMVVKIQRPLGGYSAALIYNKNKSVMFQVPWKEAAHLFNDGEDKVYYNAKKFNGKLDILDRVPNQNW